MDQTSIGQNRKSGRSPVLLSAKIDANGVEVSVILRNLSAEGALIEGTGLPAEGATTKFVRNELNVQGRIVWVEGRYAGVAFSRRLERDEILRPCAAAAATHRTPVSLALALACRPLTDGDREWLKLWATSGAAFGD